MSQQRYDARTAQNVASLQPEFGARVGQWLEKTRAQGLNPYIHFGSRSVAEQQKLYEKHLAGGPKAVTPERSYHCYGRAFDWVNIKNADGGDAGLEWNNNAVYAKGTQLGAQFQIVGIGSDDNDHLQDAQYGTCADLPRSEFGNFPGGLMA